MPIYEYQCTQCGETTEAIQRIADPPLSDCPSCEAEGALSKLLSAPAFQFKGTGWYVTDYAGKGKDEGKGEGKEKRDKGGDGDAGGEKAKPSDKGGTSAKPASGSPSD